MEFVQAAFVEEEEAWSVEAIRGYWLEKLLFSYPMFNVHDDLVCLYPGALAVLFPDREIGPATIRRGLFVSKQAHRLGPPLISHPGAMEHPLSPPKRILDRLTPLRSPQKHVARRYARTSRVTMASEVMERVQLWKVKKQHELQMRKQNHRDRMTSAKQKRKEQLQQRRERARRFSNDARIWRRYKVEASIPQWEARERLDTHERHMGVLIKRIRALCLKRRAQATPLMQPLDKVRQTGAGDLIKEVKLEELTRDIMGHYRIPQPDCKLSRERCLLTSLIIIADGDDDVYETTLGTNPERLSGYNFPGYTELHYHDDVFYSWLYNTLLCRAQVLFISFKRMVNEASLYSSPHLKFLNSWREYLSLFFVLHHFHLVRSYMLLLQVLDVLESELAIQEHGEQFPLEVNEYVTRKRIMEKQIAQSQARLKSRNDWFMYGLSYEHWVQNLYSKAMKTTTRGLTLVIPPGFTLEEWREWRLQKVLDDINGKVISGNHIETGMEAIGMTSFRTLIQGCELKGLVQLNMMLFQSFGVTLDRDQHERVLNFEEPGYIVSMQQMFNSLTGQELFITAGLTAYLSKWRSLMLQCTQKFIDESLAVGYAKFELEMFSYQLKKLQLTPQAYISELKLGIAHGGRSLPWRTLVVEHMLECLKLNKPLPLIMETIQGRLGEYYAAFTGCEVDLFLGGCGYGEHNKWRTLCDVHFEVFAPVYEFLLQ